MAIYLGWNAYGIGREAVNVLMDHELPTETRQRIKDIVLAHPEVQGLHDLRTREAGATQFIELHVEVDGDMSVGRRPRGHRRRSRPSCSRPSRRPRSSSTRSRRALEDARLDHRIARPLATAA